MQITKEDAERVLQVVDAGLCSGVGQPVPGQMCVMAAINYAFGLPHGDNPETCVGYAVRQFDITINDSKWSSDAARAKGMRREAIAKLGSNQIDQVEFSKRITLKIIQRVLPRALRAVGLETHAVACEQAQDLSSAYDASYDAAYDAYDAYAAYAAYDAYAADAADAVRAAHAAHAAHAAARAAYAADAADAAAYAADAARAAADADAAYAAHAAARAADAAYAADTARAAAYAANVIDENLTLACDLAVEVLQELGSPGCQFLDLIKE